MVRYLSILLIFMVTLTGCSVDKTPSAALQVENTPVSESAIDNAQPSNTTTTPTTSTSPQSNNTASKPSEKQDGTTPLPPGFSPDIVPMTADANIINSYRDDSIYSVTYQTSKSYNNVAAIYKAFMKDAKIIMEDTQMDRYYTINGSKNDLNFFFTVMKFGPKITTVTININSFDPNILDQANQLREDALSIPNERNDSIPLVLLDPQAYEPDPIGFSGIEIARKSVKTLAGATINVYPNDEPGQFEKIPNDVIFKQALTSNNSTSPYKDGEGIPIIYDMFDGIDVKTTIPVRGMVKYKGINYSLVEQTRNIKLTALESGHVYKPKSEIVKVQVYIPHKGDEYWVVVWNSREIYTQNLPKYLIHAEGLENMTEDIGSGSAGD